MHIKAELLEFALYEEEALKQHFHEQAQKGWFLCSMTNLFAIYEKGVPQERYYTLDYFSLETPFSFTKKKRGKDYLLFLEGYGCTYLCGNGCRHVIQLPNKHFSLYEHEEKEALRSACLRKGRRRLLMFWAFFLSFLLLSSLFASKAGISSLHMAPLFLLYLSAWLLFLLPYLTKHAGLHRISAWRSFLSIILLITGCAILLHYIFQGVLLPAVLSTSILLLGTALFILLFEKKKISLHALKRGVSALSILFMSFLIVAFFAGASTARHNNVAAIEKAKPYSHVVEQEPVLVKEPFADGEVLQNQKEENALGTRLSYSAVDHQNKKLFSYTYLKLRDEAQQEEGKRLLSCHQGVYVPVASDTSFSIYWLSDKTMTAFDGNDYLVSSFLLQEGTDMMLLQLPAYHTRSYDEALLKDYLRQISDLSFSKQLSV